MQIMRLVLALLLPSILIACQQGSAPAGAEASAVTLATLSADDRAKFLATTKGMFSAAKIIGEPTLVECTLSGGTKTTCFSITVEPTPASYAPGPWCPRNVSDGKDKSGIWLDKGTVYDADGTFMKNLGGFYKDGKWQMVDPATGAIKVTDSREKCAAAARPDVDPKYQNHCVECLTDYMPADASVTYTIPVKPVPASRSGQTNRVGAGIALNGIKLDGPAPVDAILGAYTIAPFDDCGGHVNLHVGYHYHAVTNCLTSAAKTSSTPVHATPIGLAMDGYKIFSHFNGDGKASADLDSCQGHKTAGDGYHYHAGAAGSNKIIGCLTAQYGCSSTDAKQSCDASAQRGPPR
jgi:YHYH protein